MNVWPYVVFAIAAVVLSVAAVAAVRYLPSPAFWLQCRLSGVPVTFKRLLRWNVRKIEAREIVFSAIRLRKGGVEVSLDELEAVAARGGKLMNCATAMIVAQRSGLGVSWEEIVAMDADGLDAFEEMQRVAQAGELSEV